jgi:hypothetical protein
MSQEVLSQLPKRLAVGHPVSIMFPDSEKDEDWLAVPMDFKMSDVPEGYTLPKKWGNITGYDFEGARSYEGKQFIVVEKHIYVGYNPEHWR